MSCVSDGPSGGNVTIEVSWELPCPDLKSSGANVWRGLSPRLNVLKTWKLSWHEEHQVLDTGSTLRFGMDWCSVFAEREVVVSAIPTKKTLAQAHFTDIEHNTPPELKLHVWCIVP